MTSTILNLPPLPPQKIAVGLEMAQHLWRSCGRITLIQHIKTTTFDIVYHSIIMCRRLFEKQDA